MATSRENKRTVREAKQYVKDTSHHVRRARDVSSDVTRRVDEELNTLRQAIVEADVDAIKASRDAIDALLDEHFDIEEKSAFREYAESIGLAILFALLLRGFVFEAFKIPTGSMIPTLLIGDHIFVNKFRYGIRVPFTETYVVEFAEPARGEVVVFTFPSDDAREYLAAQPVHMRQCIDRRSLHENRDFIKRIIGVAGDTVEIRDRALYVNGQLLNRERISEEPTNQYMSPNKIRERETNGDFTYTIQYQRTDADFGPIKVKEGHVFAMGDHRDNSADGRCWGQVPVENMKGRAIFIWFSAGDAGIRWNRLGQFIHD